MPFVKPDSTRPKRLLSLDGGGIRGLISAEVLIQIEDILKQLKPGLSCLADYFDFIGGTSTGSILAAGLAKGMGARQLRNIYYNNGPAIFQEQFFILQLWAKYTPVPLESLLQSTFAGITLGSQELRTLLMIVTKNTTSGNTWFFVNNPNNKYYRDNSQIPLWHIIRASSAAPTYFPPHQFQVGSNSETFIDGGVTPYNNPSWQLFLEATQPSYNVGWETGADRLLQVSVGTGFSVSHIPEGQAKDYTLLNWAPYTVGALMDGANVQQNLLMELISDRPPQEERELDKSAATALSADEIATIRGLPALLVPEMEVLRAVRDQMPKLLTYRRYTTAFTKKRFQQLQQVSGLTPSEVDLLAQAQPAAVANLDCVDQRDLLCAIGRAIALEQVRPQLFEPFLQDD